MISGYANPLRNLYLKEALHALIHKKAVERVRVRASPAFFNRLFIVPKPNQKWGPILDLSALNKFLSVKTFKMETPETIRISLQQGECPTRSTLAPITSCRPSLYRRRKRRLGCSLRRLHSKRFLVSSRKSLTHKFSGVKGHVAGPNKVPVLGKGPDRLSSHRRHYSCGIHQQGGRYEVRLTLCPSLAPPVLVQSETYCPQGQTHNRPSECDCRQAVPTRLDNPDGMVSSSGGIRTPVSNLAPSTGRHVCDQIQLQAEQVRIPSPGPELLGSGCSDSLLGGSGHVCLSPSIPFGQSGQETVGSPVPQNNPESVSQIGQIW